MASNNEAGSSKGPIPNEDVSVHKLNELFPKVDNLEYFPLKVLLQIFTLLDDIDLLSLAETSVRFENIAKMVVTERYTTKYLVAMECYGSEWYVDFVRRFGSEIKSIKVKAFHVNEFNHWVAEHWNLLSNLKRLKCDLYYTNANTTKFFQLRKYGSSTITHFTLRAGKRGGYINGDGFVEHLNFHSLKHLELQNSPCISFDTLKETIYNNPGLESLLIRNSKAKDKQGRDILGVYPFDELMKVIVETAAWNPLKEFAYIPIYYGQIPGDYVPTETPDHIIDAFVDSLKHLESLALSADYVKLCTNPVELLHRFATRCKNIKHLKLHTSDTVEEIDMIQSFQRIESLELHVYRFEFDIIESLVESLPYLRCLHLEQYKRTMDSAFVLNVLSKCPTLEKLTIASVRVNDFEIFASTKFFNVFKECIQTRNVVMKVKHYNQRIGTITKNQVVWRNKLVHWVGYDPSRKSSQVNLMDLVMKKSSDTGEQQDNMDPFDMILSFLDLNSLQSLSNTNRKCSQLVDSFIQQQAQQQGTFMITNEFFTPLNPDYKRLEKFAMHVTSLKVNVYHENVTELREMIEQFPNLKKMHVFASKPFASKPSKLIVPQIRHFIFDGYFRAISEFYNLARMCPDLETLEFKRYLSCRGSTMENIAFRRLKKFIFQFSSDFQLQQIQEIFRDANPQLIIE